MTPSEGAPAMWSLYACHEDGTVTGLSTGRREFVEAEKKRFEAMDGQILGLARVKSFRFARFIGEWVDQ